jgi:hypothetical protein
MTESVTWPKCLCTKRNVRHAAEDSRPSGGVFRRQWRVVVAANPRQVVTPFATDGPPPCSPRRRAEPKPKYLQLYYWSKIARPSRRPWVWSRQTDLAPNGAML